MIHTLSIDLETRSGADLKKTGVYRYTEDPEFDILLFGYSADGGPVDVIDVASGEPIPEEILQAVVSEETVKWAYNATFERICLSAWLRKHRPDLFRGYGDESDSTRNYLNPASWHCSMVWAATLGLPLSLESVGSILKLQDQKMTEGKSLIRFFSVPCRSTAANGHRTWNRPTDALQKWQTFKAYNKRDVEVEMAIQEKLKNFPVSDNIWEEYHLSETINDRGIRLDMKLVQNAIAMDARARNELSAEMQALTEIDNPNSAAQMKQWLKEHGLDTETLDKKAVKELIQTAPEELRKPLLLRQQLAKSSVRKYLAMENCVCADGRCRGMFQFYGANRSGRWAGRLVQLQNLPQNKMPDLKEARALAKQGDYEMLRLLYEDVPDTLSQLIRTAFIPEEGMKFIVSDYSAVEARALSFLAGEQWRMDVFHNGGDIYCKSASAMFKVPVEKHGINGHLRQKGKIAELACGYGGSVGALKAMGAVEMGIPEEELKPLVDAWREANPKIVEYWWQVDEAAKKAIRTRTPQQVGLVSFEMISGMLFITLPSGRKLAYVMPRIEPNPFGSESITYFGLDAQKHWSRIESYGPKIVENIVQAICRDLLADTMKNLRRYRIVGHVHDEVIIEVPEDTSVETITDIMGQTPEWIRGLELRGDGTSMEWYRKD